VTIQVLNGANLGRLGTREPESTGTTTYAELVELLEEAAAELGLDVRVRQTDDEGELLRWDPRGVRRRRPRRHQPRRLVAHVGGAARRARALHAPLVEVHITTSTGARSSGTTPTSPASPTA
jgi:3-dehydroquinate dehydratase-2